MRASTRLLFRLLGAFVGAAIFAFVGLLLNRIIGNPSQQNTYTLIVGAIGAVIGLLLTPYILKHARISLEALSSRQLGGFMIGILSGLFAAALFTYPLAQLPGTFGRFMPVLVAVAGSYLGGITGARRAEDIITFVKDLRPYNITSNSADKAPPQAKRAVLLDTSVIIDGRIADVSKTGFLNATMIVPSFVLHELQNIADSPDPVRRKRGRRGLEILNVLRTECPLPFEVSDLDVSEVRDVDSKLVALARHLNHAIMTNDYNLNRVAGLQGVNVLNINDLANAIKATFLPGEELEVKIIQEGREYGQGVGYLDDGTMVVIEDGIAHMNQVLDVHVTKVLQTSAGRMIFARLTEDDNGR